MAVSKVFAVARGSKSGGAYIVKRGQGGVYPTTSEESAHAAALAFKPNEKGRDGAECFCFGDGSKHGGTVYNANLRVFPS